jgi:hypothetical protein
MSPLLCLTIERHRFVEERIRRQGLLPNGQGMSRAALIDRQGRRAYSIFQNAADLGPRSGVGSMPMLGRRSLTRTLYDCLCSVSSSLI